VTLLYIYSIYVRLFSTTSCQTGQIDTFGAFASLEEGMEGLIPRAELPAWMNPFQHLHEGLQLPLRILEFDPERHHLKLSLTQASQ
jgi:ribosomal protein S1